MKYIKTFENNEKIYIGSYIFEVEEDGINLDDFNDYEDFDDYFINLKYKIIYELNEFKLVILNRDENDTNDLYLVHNIAKDLSYPYYKDLKKDDFMKKISDYANIVKLYKNIINKTISEVENIPEIKYYIKNKAAKKFKI